MAEYIERETLINVLEGEIEDCGYADASNKPIAYGTILGLKSALSYAKSLPAADVVEVVRCKDCEYFVIKPNYRLCSHKLNRTLNSLLEISSNHFCSYGKKKEGAENE